MNSVSDLYIIGNGGHARVIGECAKLAGINVIFVVTTLSGPNEILESRFLAKPPSNDGKTGLICGIGSSGRSSGRRQVLEKYAAHSGLFCSIVHPKSSVAPTARIGAGTFIAQGAQVCSQAVLEDHVILNTGAIVDHDCWIGTGSHVASGAVLAGAVRCGPYTHVGAGATIIQGVKIEHDVVIGAGAVIIRDINTPGELWIGVPGKAQHG